LSWLAPILLFASTTQELSTTVRGVLLGSAVLFGGVSLGLILVVLFPEFALKVIALLLRPLPSKFSEPARELALTFTSGFAILRRGRLLLSIVVLSQGIWLGEALVYLLVAWALHLQAASLIALAATVAVSNLATSVPSSSGGLGPFEAGAIAGLVLFGVDRDIAASYAILVHLTLLVPVTAVGFVFLLIEGVSLKEATRLPSLAVAPAPGKEVEG
ncbi:MAG: flippase-like domain-containing protein, partial [SAR202 cluster bacterium]|nr:flippase-like domain-containing protein [SAR202 cluster bacterium]